MKTHFRFLFNAILALFILLSCKDTESSVPADVNNTLKLRKKKPVYSNNKIENLYKAISVAKKNKNISNLATSYFNLGHYFLSKNKSDSAFFYFNHSKEAFLLEKNKTFAGKSLINMSIIQSNEGDYFGSEETAVEALRYLKSPQDNSYLSAVYNCLAISKTEQKDYSQAIEYYNQSLKFPANKLSEINIKNNIAVVNIRAKNYVNALKILSTLSKDTILNNFPQDLARITDNFAYARYLNNFSHNVEEDLYKALKIRETIKDSLGLIASNYHLSEYFEKKNIRKAIFHATEMYKIAFKLGTPEDQLEALEKLILLDTPSSNKSNYFNTYLKLNDIIQSAKSRAKNQFALIRYEVEKNKEENAQLKAENTQKNYQILKQRVIFFSITGLTTLNLILLIFWYRRRKVKFRQEKIEEVNRTKLRYSKKIHDEVANGIYFLIVQLENNSDVKPTKIIDELEELYHKSRDISHDAEFKIDNNEDFSITLRNMIKPYGAKDTKIIIIGNESHIWMNFSVEKKEEIYYLLKELMTNMKKHSKATIVTLKFKKESSTLLIEYSDNGIGLLGSSWDPKNSFKNIKTRLDSIQGNYYIDHEKMKGFSIKISILI